MSYSTSTALSSSEPPTPAANVLLYPYRFSGNLPSSSRIPLRVLGTTIMCAFLKVSCGEECELARSEKLKRATEFFIACSVSSEKDALTWFQLFLLGKKILNDTDSVTERELLDISAYLLTPFTSNNRLRVDILAAYKTLITFLVCAEGRQRRERTTEISGDLCPVPFSLNSSSSSARPVMSSFARTLVRVRQSLDSAMQHPRSRPLHIHSSVSCLLCSTYPKKPPESK